MPSDVEWKELTDYLGRKDVAGYKLKSSSGWNTWECNIGNGSNSRDFKGLPCE
ncbi:MAG: hypothetical protein SGI83_06590 [Bacteroidota bacterium]|nr:hypothetical protein [Bacteroidota bacterium]